MLVGFPRLINEVIKTNKCALCGTCEAVCPNRVIEIVGSKPMLKGACLLCDVCYVFCPMVDGAAKESEYKFLRPKRRDEQLGCYIDIYLARSKLKEVLNVAQDGGFVTTMLIYLLDNEAIDGAVVTTVDEEWNPEPTVATTREQVLEGAGTSYAVSPNLKALHEAVIERRMKRLAVVGTPCQINAARILQLSPSVSGLGSPIYLTIGLFCTESFDYETLRQYLEQNEIKIKDVRKFDIKRGRFLAISKGGWELMNVPIKKMKGIARNSCRYCGDYTAEYADVSVGSVGSPDGWSTVIIRSEKALKVFEELVKEGWLEAAPVEHPGIDTVRRLSRKKKEAAGF